MKTAAASGLAARVLTAAPGADVSAAGPLFVEVAARPYDRPGTPAWFTLPESWRNVTELWLTGVEDGVGVPVQRVRQPRPAAVWMVRDLPAGASRRYRLEAVTRSPERPRVTWADDGRGCWLLVGTSPVLRYNHAEIPAPAGLDPVYRRSGHIHPLYTPAGAVVTDDFPPDHAHQHGLFFAWVNTTFAGHHVDFWNQTDRSGSVRHQEILDRGYGPVFGHLSARLRHDDVTRPAAPVPVLEEDWTVRVYDRSDVFLVDFESRQRCIASQPLVLNRYHYGGLGVRGNRAWLDPRARGDASPDPARSGHSDFLTSEGRHRADGNHTRPRWVDLSGQVGTAEAGVAVFDHPGNARFPQPVRLHPNKPYFSVAPVVLGDWTIAPGQTYVSRYRLVVHDGRPDRELLDRLWTDFAGPPEVRVASDERAGGQ
jgi:hypothetical protein